MAGDEAQGAGGGESRGIDALTGFLEEAGVDYETVEHDQTFTSAQEARAAGVAPGHTAKTVLLREGGDYRVAVIPASHRLDLHKARDVLGAGAKLRLATEEEMEADFDAFEVGALPPFGPLVPAPEVIDGRLLDHERVLCTGGDHRHSVLVDPNEIVRVTAGTVADVCEE